MEFVEGILKDRGKGLEVRGEGKGARVKGRGTKKPGSRIKSGMTVGCWIPPYRVQGRLIETGMTGGGRFLPDGRNDGEGKVK